MIVKEIPLSLLNLNMGILQRFYSLKGKEDLREEFFADGVISEQHLEHNDRKEGKRNSCGGGTPSHSAHSITSWIHLLQVVHCDMLAGNRTPDETLRQCGSSHSHDIFRKEVTIAFLGPATPSRQTRSFAHRQSHCKFSVSATWPEQAHQLWRWPPRHPTRSCLCALMMDLRNFSSDALQQFSPF